MKNYNSEIAKLGTISDPNIIFACIDFFVEHEDITETRKEFVERNAFGINRASTRKDYFGVIRRLFLNDYEKEPSHFFVRTVSSVRDRYLKKALLYLEVFRKNDLFHDITTELIYNKFHENRKIITSREVFDFIIELGEKTGEIDLSESTLRRMATKYISFMKKLGYLEEVNQVKSELDLSYPEERIATYIVYLLKAAGKTDNEVYTSDLYRAFLLTEEEKVELLKKGSLAGYYNFNLSGSNNALIELNYSREEIIDELSG